MASLKNIVKKPAKAPSRTTQNSSTPVSKDKGRLSAAEFREREDARREQLSVKLKHDRAMAKVEAAEARKDPPKVEQRPSGFSKLMHELTYGAIKPKVSCPHCHTIGSVRVKSSRQKAGVSGAKLTGALLTGGLSIFATGLSRKETVTFAYCDTCTVKWSL
jgi:hypothetical protein